MRMPSLQTERLLLRDWHTEDANPFFEMNSSPNVMRYFPKTLSREESDQMIVRLQNHISENGFGFFAVESRATHEFMGFIGLVNTSFTSHFTPCTEVGWRLAEKFWNQGFATEGAKKMLQFGFTDLNLPEIVSLTAVPNIPSRRVMEKIGMTRDVHGDFIHPRVSEGHPMAKHVLYRLKKFDWLAQS